MQSRVYLRGKGKENVLAAHALSAICGICAAHCHSPHRPQSPVPASQAIASQCKPVQTAEQLTSTDRASDSDHGHVSLFKLTLDTAIALAAFCNQYNIVDMSSPLSWRWSLSSSGEVTT